ncbi:MAG: hypothetical protein NTY75_03765, partial [Candidatus Shapirobacteria bacterium]|nr:hypothetical protein [Candidatus Shapirobacteria bacterium]
MDTSLPTALIVGMENFGAKELAVELVARGLAVIGVGDYVAGMSEYSNFENRIYFKDVIEEVRYIFDFEGGESFLEKARKDQAKLIKVRINKKAGKFDTGKLEGIDRRAVKLRGMFGPGMDKNSDESTDFLVRAAEAAAKNKNLILPGKNKKVRLLSVRDGVEIMIRAAMMPGLNGVEMEMWGKEITSEKLAEKLIDVAKMTRFKVEESGEEVEYPERKVVEREWGKIRWEPEAEWDKDIETMLQYFLVKADEEGRKPKEKNPSVLRTTPLDRGAKSERLMTEVVEVEEESPKPKVQNLKEEIKVEVLDPEKEKEWELEKIVIKNSNNRLVAIEPDFVPIDRDFVEAKEEINATASSNPSAPTFVGAAPLDKGAKKTKWPKFRGLRWWGLGVLAV